MSDSPQRLKGSIGRPFWIGFFIGAILFLVLSMLWGPRDSFGFRLDVGIAIIVFGPVSGILSQAGHDLFVAGRLGVLRTWDFLVFIAIAAALVVAGEALYHAPFKEGDVDPFRNHTFAIAVIFIFAMLLIYAISKNFGHFLSRYTWIVILSTIALLAAFIGIYRLTGFDLSWILVIGTALWAAIDSAKIHLKDFECGIAYGPAVLFFGFLLVWPIAFPWYLIIRHQIKTGAATLKGSVQEPIEIGNGAAR